MIDRTSIEILPADWRTRAKTLRRYGGETSAVALEACAAELETALRQRDDTILTLTEAAGGKAATPPLTWDAWCARARSQTPEGPAHPGSLEGTSPMRPGRWPSLVWRRSLPCARFPPGRSCSASSRRVSDDGTKRSRRRSYSAGERGRNRVLVFPDPGTGLIRIEWREGGRRLTKSLGHRDWDRAKRQADAVAAGRVQPLTPVELRPLPSAPALQIPELLPSPVLQSASSADAPRPAARPPLPLLVSFRPLREAQLAAAAQPRRFPALCVEPRLIPGPVTATWTPYGRHTKYPRPTLPSN